MSRAAASTLTAIAIGAGSHSRLTVFDNASNVCQQYMQLANIDLSRGQ